MATAKATAAADHGSRQNDTHWKKDTEQYSNLSHLCGQPPHYSIPGIDSCVALVEASVDSVSSVSSTEESTGSVGSRTPDVWYTGTDQSPVSAL
jgi:hypothetical protein